MSTVATRKRFKKVNSNNSHFTTSTSWTTLTGLVATLQCSGQRPVLVKLVERSAIQAFITANLGNATNGSVSLRVVASWSLPVPSSTTAETTYGRNFGINVGQDIRKFPPSFAEWIVYPAAGLVTFTIQGLVSGSIQALQTDGVDLFVMEL